MPIGKAMADVLALGPWSCRRGLEGWRRADVASAPEVVVWYKPVPATPTVVRMCRVTDREPPTQLVSPSAEVRSRQLRALRRPNSERAQWTASSRLI